MRFTSSLRIFVLVALLTACGARSGIDVSGSSTSTSSPGVETCPGVDTWIELSVDGGEPMLLTQACTGPFWKWGENETAGPLGFYAKTPAIAITGCLTDDPESLAVIVYGIGVPAETTYDEGAANFLDAEGTLWGYAAGDEATFTVTKLEPTGGLIEGSFTTVVTALNGPVKATLSGSFRVCHVTDAWKP